MTVCIRCKRPLRLPAVNGLGPVCAKRSAQPAPARVERDLFGYDIEAATDAAYLQVLLGIEIAAAEAQAAIRAQFHIARVRLGVWSK
jgi:hypothetical protein